MEWILLICVIIIVLLLIKIYLMKKATREITTELSEYVKPHTNALLTVSCRDRDIRILADALNKNMQEVREAYRKYILGDREMKTAITNISHDLRTPLTAICGYLTLGKRLEKSDELSRYLAIMEERALYMKKLTEELFAYSMLLSSEEEQEKEEVLINRLLEDCLMEYYAALVEKGITPVVEITDTKIIRKLDKSRMERVLSNLISNAIKYSDGDLVISLTDSGMITFSNEASGLSTVEVERIFDRFYTVETARKATGIGLSIAKAFVEQMGGKISARYEEGRLIIEIIFSE